MNHRIATHGAVAIAALAVATAAAHAAGSLPQRTVGVRPAASPSSYFYTEYAVWDDKTSITWSTCGHDTTSEGCYGAGTLGPFGRVCAVAGSSTLVVVADAMKDGQSALSIYRQEESSTPSATLLRTVPIAIPASATATCHLAIGGQFAYFGTGESSQYYRVDLKTGGTLHGAICGGVASSITANDKLVIVSMSGCFDEYDKFGVYQGGGGEFTDEFAPSQNAFRP